RGGGRGRSGLAGGIDADPHSRLRRPLPRTRFQHSPLAPPRLPWSPRPAPGPRSRRTRGRSDRPLRGRGSGLGSHRAAGRGARARRRHRGDSGPAHPRRGASYLSGSRPALRGGSALHRGPHRQDQGEPMSPVRRALLSVHDKTRVVDFARGLAALGVQILSTGGTAKLLRDSGVPVLDVSEVTGFPEMLDGRVKTLHPKVHGGILARRDVPAHMRALEAHGIGPIDLVVVALYPFEQTVAKPEVGFEEVIENIDIGGPSMIRGA